MSAAPKDNNMMWLALAIGGGVIAYSYLRKDAIAVVDTAVDTVKKVANLANPLSQGNILTTAINATGQAISQNPNWTGGTALNEKFAPQVDTTKGVKYVSVPAQKINGLWKKQINGQWITISNDEKVVTNAKGQLIVMVDQADLLTPNISNATQTKFVQLPARQVNGAWQKQINGVWYVLGTNDKVNTIQGKPVVLVEYAL